MATHTYVPPTTVAPALCSLAAMQFSKYRFTHPPGILNTKSGGNAYNKFYEHLVASWALTALKITFSGGQWILTPEKQDAHSDQKPDLVVEKMGQTPPPNVYLKADYYLIMELKSKTGERLEDAVYQTVNRLAETLDADEVFEVYVVVQRGKKIAFFEYHNDITNLKEEGIPNFEGCVPLTYDYHIDNIPAVVLQQQDKPNDMEDLYLDTKCLRTDQLKNKKKKELRKRAQNFHVKCVFDLDRHEPQIDLLFYHMAIKAPRSSC